MVLDFKFHYLQQKIFAHLEHQLLLWYWEKVRKLTNPHESQTEIKYYIYISWYTLALTILNFLQKKFSYYIKYPSVD